MRTSSACFACAPRACVALLVAFIVGFAVRGAGEQLRNLIDADSALARAGAPITARISAPFAPARAAPAFAIRNRVAAGSTAFVEGGQRAAKRVGGAARTTRICAFGEAGNPKAAPRAKTCDTLCAVPNCPPPAQKPAGHAVAHRQRCALRTDACCSFACVDDFAATEYVAARDAPLSAHSCFGENGHVDDALGAAGGFLKRTCRYWNVCYLPRYAPGDAMTADQPHWGSGRGSLVYVAESTEEAEALRASDALSVGLAPLNAHKTVKPSGWASKLTPVPLTRAAFAAALSASRAAGARAEAPRVRRGDGAVADAAALLPFAKSLHVLYSSYNAENFGHFLTDELLPAFSALEAFGAATRDVQLLRAPLSAKHQLTFSCEWQRREWGEVQWEKCLQRYAELTLLLSDRPVREFEAYVAEVAAARGGGGGGGDVLCFDELVAGFGMLADHCDDATTHGRFLVRDLCNRGRAPQLFRFRQWMIDALDITPPPTRDTVLRRVLVWDRAPEDYKPERKIFGLEALCAEIEALYAAGPQHVACERFVQWTGVPIATQVSGRACSRRNELRAPLRAADALSPPLPASFAQSHSHLSSPCLSLPRVPPAVHRSSARRATPSLLCETGQLPLRASKSPAWACPGSLGCVGACGACGA